MKNMVFSYKIYAITQLFLSDFTVVLLHESSMKFYTKIMHVNHAFGYQICMNFHIILLSMYKFYKSNVGFIYENTFKIHVLYH